MNNYHLTFGVPPEYTEELCQAIGDAGAGIIGNYSHCIFTTKGIARFIPLPGSTPHDGVVGEMQWLPVDQVHVRISQEHLAEVLQVLKQIHPWEEIGYSLVEEASIF